MKPSAAVELAIRLLHPELSSDLYSRAILEASRLADVDPIVLVAYVEHESRFTAGAVSGDGEDYGLGQVRARFQRPCRRSRASVKCRAEKARLLADPAYNMRVVAWKIRAAKKGKSWRKSRTPGTWLAALAGTPNPRHKRVLEVLEISKRIKAALRSGSGARFTCLGG